MYIHNIDPVMVRFNFTLTFIQIILIGFLISFVRYFLNFLKNKSWNADKKLITELVWWGLGSMFILFMTSKFHLEVRYYGLVYAAGFLGGMWYLAHLAKKKEIAMTEEQVYDFFTWLIVGGIIGGRLMHVIFFDPVYYLANPIKIFYVWEGGMAFHGGAIGAILATLFYSRKHKIPFYDISDALVFPTSIALVFGRIANFINGELYGRVTDVWWAVKFPGVEGYRHPSQLYESAKNLVIFGVLSFVKTLKPAKGILTWTFFMGYGVLRFIIEFWRQPDWFGWGLSAGQWLSLVTVAVSGYMLYKVSKN